MNSINDSIHYLRETKLFNEMLNNNGEVLVFDFRTKEEYEENNLAFYTLNLPHNVEVYNKKFCQIYDPSSWEKLTTDKTLKAVIKRLKRFFILIVVSSSEISKAKLKKLEAQLQDSNVIDEIDESPELKAVLFYKMLAKNKIRELGFFIGDYSAFLSEFKTILYHNPNNKVFNDPYPSSIIDSRFYVGNEYHAKTWEILERLKITHVINVTKHAPNYYEKTSEIKYSKIEVEDCYDNFMRPHYKKCYEFIEEAYFGIQKQNEETDLEHKLLDDEIAELQENLKLKQTTSLKNEILQLIFKKLFVGSSNNSRIFVHCSLGVSRSSTVALLYLMKKMSMRYSDALEILKFHRNKSNPIETFAHELQEFEEKGYSFD